MHSTLISRSRKHQGTEQTSPDIITSSNTSASPCIPTWNRIRSCYEGEREKEEEGNEEVEVEVKEEEKEKD